MTKGSSSQDRKSTRLNSSHDQISYAVFCLKKKELVGIAHPALLRLSELPVPVVTAINGPVGGGGIGWALCGDFALAAASMKLRTGYAAIGLSPDMGASHFIARRVGSMRARQLFMLSDPVDARQCLELGL